MSNYGGRERSGRTIGGSIGNSMGEEYKGGSTRRRNLDESMYQLDRGQGQGDQNIQEELDDANINVELEQGRAQGAGKLQYALLK